MNVAGAFTMLDAWDLVRGVNLLLGLSAMVIMVCRYRMWLHLPTAERFHWLATGGVTTATTYANIELFLRNTPGGPRLAVLFCALVYLHIALLLARGKTPVALVPTDKKEPHRGRLIRPDLRADPRPGQHRGDPR